VQGHVDATATVASIENDGEALLIRFKAPDSVMPYIVEKGFITIDGTSMTIVDCDADTFVVTVIPFTSEHTIFGTRKIGDRVNLETDIIAKYVQNLLAESR
jgi:riboflavin synthase